LSTLRIALLEALLAAGGLDDVHLLGALPLQDRPDQSARRRMVIHHQDPLGQASLLSKYL
jgi:hypothetical protein